MKPLLMMSIKILSLFSASKTTSTPNPMSIILSMVVTALLIGSESSSKNSSPWPAIMMIMSINGGLMILYIFAISMMQQEKKEEKSNPSVFIPIAGVTASMCSSNSEKSQYATESMFSSNGGTMVTMTIIMLVAMLLTIKMAMNPFKTLKSM